MRQYNLLASDVDVKELATETKNYSGAELEGLVRAAQSTAMNRHIKVRVFVFVLLWKTLITFKLCFDVLGLHIRRQYIKTHTCWPFHRLFSASLTSHPGVESWVLYVCPLT